MIAAALLACALNVAPVTVQAVIEVESGNNPLALHVNGIARQPAPAGSADQAARIADQFIARGYSVDLGLMQVNSRNLPALGLTVRQALDPCPNIRVGSAILAADYAAALQVHPAGQPALKAALSLYNTGDPRTGFATGYVARYYGNKTSAAARPDPFTASTTVYRRRVSHVGTD